MALFKNCTFPLLFGKQRKKLTINAKEPHRIMGNIREGFGIMQRMVESKENASECNGIVQKRSEEAHLSQQ